MLVLFADPDPNLGAEQHKFMYAQLGTLSKHPEFTTYLAYILMFLPQHAHDVSTWIPHGGPNQVEEIRSRAGLELKNRIKDQWATVDAPTRQYVKQVVLVVLGDSSQFLRNIVGTIVTTICKKEGIQNWPGILEQLVRMLDSGQHAPMEGSFNALAKICEDMPKGKCTMTDTERLVQRGGELERAVTAAQHSDWPEPRRSCECACPVVSCVVCLQSSTRMSCSVR
jgi:hypothetical protein